MPAKDAETKTKPDTTDQAPDFDAPKPETPKDTPARPRPAVRKPPLKKQLEDAFATIAVAIMATGDEYCATVVAQQAEPLAEAWAELAKVNPRVKALLERLMQGSAWSGVIIATAATAIPIASHHGMYPKDWPMPFSFGIGPPPPESAEVKHAREAKDTGGDSRDKST